jgi:hypothetical protein
MIVVPLKVRLSNQSQAHRPLPLTQQLRFQQSRYQQHHQQWQMFQLAGQQQIQISAGNPKVQNHKLADTIPSIIASFTVQ